MKITGILIRIVLASAALAAFGMSVAAQSQGSMAIVSPGMSFGPRLGVPKLGTWGSPWGLSPT